MIFSTKRVWRNFDFRKLPFSKHSGLSSQNCPTKHAPDVWDSTAFSSIFLASSFFCPQIKSTPSAAQIDDKNGTSRKSLSRFDFVAHACLF
jgi:hypothetical protein